MILEDQENRRKKMSEFDIKMIMFLIISLLLLTIIGLMLQ